MTIGIFEAKQKLSELVERASKGEEIIITRRLKLIDVILFRHRQLYVSDKFSTLSSRRARQSFLQRLLCHHDGAPFPTWLPAFQPSGLQP